MNTILQFYKKTKKRLFPRKSTPYPVVLRPTGNFNIPIGCVLFSYLEYSLLWPENSINFNGHSNAWESRAIVKIFQELGYQVEAINYKDRIFTPIKHYDVIFDIFENLGRWSVKLDNSTKKILHCTGSDPYYQNSAEIRRVDEVNKRRNASCSPKRLVAQPELTYKSMDAADAISLIGNERTLATYPQKYKSKIELVTVTASFITQTKPSDNFVPSKREFLWYFGRGAVHKGLDLLLEVFATHPELQLHIVGSVAAEKDFYELYKKELTATENIHYHGYLIPSNAEFQTLLADIFCFIAPTCSESISTAAATCMQLGLYPIISRDTGITLPANCGLYIEELSIVEIEKLVLATMEMKDDEIIRQTRQTQAEALSHFSRSAFQNQMKKFIVTALA